MWWHRATWHPAQRWRSGLLLLLALAQTLAPQSLSVIHKKKLWGDGHGTIHITENAIIYEATKAQDSRTWPEGTAVPAKLLVGKPLIVHFPARHVELGGWSFQVPDPTKIRYIR